MSAVKSALILLFAILVCDSGDASASPQPQAHTISCYPKECRTKLTTPF